MTTVNLLWDIWRDKYNGGNLWTNLRQSNRQRRKRYKTYNSRSRLANKRHVTERPASVKQVNTRGAEKSVPFIAEVVITASWRCWSEKTVQEKDTIIKLRREGIIEFNYFCRSSNLILGNLFILPAMWKIKPMLFDYSWFFHMHHSSFAKGRVLQEAMLTFFSICLLK